MKKIILTLIFLLMLSFTFLTEISGTLFAQNDNGTNGWYYGTFYVQPDGHVVFYCPAYVTVERCRVSIPKDKEIN